MNIYLHTIIAILPMFATYLIGKNWGRKILVENIVRELISALDRDGFIKTVRDKDGELELVPISEIIAKTLKGCQKPLQKTP